MTRRGRAAALSGVALAALAAGCTSPPGRDAVAGTADRWLAAASAGDPAALCRLLTPAAADAAATGDETCEQAVADLDLPGAGPVGAVAVWSDRAQVRTGGDTLFLTRFEDGWRVSGAGWRPRGDRPYDCDLAG